MNRSLFRAAPSCLAVALATSLAALGCGGATLEPFAADDAGEASDSGHVPPVPGKPDSGACTPEVSPTTCGANVVFPCGLVSGSNGTPLDQKTCDLVCGSTTTGTCYVYESVTAGGSVFVPCGPCGGS